MKQVWALWAELPDRPFRVLLYMAMRVPDSETSPRWYGSPDELAVAIGDQAIVDGPRRKTVMNRISLAVTALVDAGALAVVSRQAPGRRAVYELRVSMQQSRYSRDRSTDGRRSNNPGKYGTTVPKTTGLPSRKLRDPMSSEDVSRTRTGTQTSRNEVARGDRALRAIDGGRNEDDPDDGPVQLPFLAAVPAPDPEPVTHQRFVEGVS